MPVVMKCKHCSAEFKVRPSHVSKRTFCSKECQGKDSTRSVMKECVVCKKQFKVPGNKWRIDAKYCSQQCKGKDHSGESHWNYKGEGNRMEDDIEHVRARRRKNALANPNVKDNLRRGKMKRERNLVVEHTFIEWIELLKKHDNICYYCGVRMTKTPGIKQRTRDHLIPVSKGGSDKIENIVPACRSCNSKKGTNTFEEYTAKVEKMKR